MRWHDWLIFAVMGALLGGALLLARQAIAQPGIGRAYHDTYFVVVHAGGVASYALPLAGALVLHFALVRRAAPPLPALGAVSVAVLAAGLTAAFFPGLLLGRAGMPRRYEEYPEAFAAWTAVSTAGAVLAGLAALALLGSAAAALRRGPRRP